MLPSAVSDSRVHNILPNKIETDFQFSRASAATRVNHQGLIENVGYFSDELVRNGNFSELGPELITNGDFATDSDWGFIGTANISNGCGVFPDTTSSFIYQINVFDLTVKTYKLVYEVKETNSGTLQLSGGNSAFGVVNLNSSIGTHTFYLVSNGTKRHLQFFNASSFVGKIDNVSVKQVDPDNDWSLGTGWSFGDNKVIFDGGADAAVQQSNVVQPSTLYRASFTVADRTTGSLQLRLGNTGAVDVTVTDNGNFSFDLTTDATGTSVYFRAIGGFNGSISSVSVKQIFGDKPRLDYEPINPTCPHLLLEPQSTNLIDFSENLKDGYTTTNASVDLNNSIAPDGKTTANKFNSTALLSKIQKTYSNSSATSHTISIFLKKGTIDLVAIDILGGGPAIAASTTVNLTTGVITASTSTGSITPIITELPNDWYRITASSTSNGVVANPTISIINKSSVADGYFYMWGLQFEGLSYATSYIPTAGATETRVQETCTSAGNLNTFNNSEGTIYAEIAGLVSSTTLRSIGISDGTSANRVNISLWQNGGNDQLLNFVGLGGVSQCNFFGAVNSILEFNKVAFNYKQDDFKMYINGVLVGTDTSGNTFPADTLIKFNFDRGEGSTKFFGKTKSLATYNRALTDTELYTITSTQYSAYSGMVAALGNYTIPC